MEYFDRYMTTMNEPGIIRGSYIFILLTFKKGYNYIHIYRMKAHIFTNDIFLFLFTFDNAFHDSAKFTKGKIEYSKKYKKCQLLGLHQLLLVFSWRIENKFNNNERSLLKKR